MADSEDWFDWHDWIHVMFYFVPLLAFFVVAWWMQRPRNFPPGPWRWPLLGFFPQLAWYMYKGEQLHEILMRLGHKYGKLYSVDIFGYPFVVINDFSIIREGFNKPALNNKGHNHALLAKMFGQFYHSYKHNDEYRKFALTALRGLGIGKRSFEGNILTESKILLHELETLSGEPCNPDKYFVNVSANILFAVVLGKRFEYDDDNFRHLTEMNAKVMRLLGSGGFAVSALPIDIPNKASNDLSKMMDDLNDFIDRLIAEHREKFDPEHLDDFIDVYFNEMDKKPKPDDPCSYLQKDNMRAALYGLFLAGTDTISTTLRWCCLYMMAYPNVQKKIAEELDTVVGRDRLPQLSDQEHVPYTRATLLEIQRVVVLAPLADFHSAGEETTLRGYRIPKGCVVISNVYAVMKDPEVFPEPELFKPERFINDDGEYVEREEVCPFGIGRRMCFGDRLAKVELFLLFTHLLHRFSFVKPDGAPPITFEGEHGLVFTPNPFTVKFVARD